MSKRKSGFSLIELIVVITIIGVITAVAMVSFGGASKKSRDSRRISDLERYRVALEMYRQIGGTYPDVLDKLIPAPYNLISGTLADPKSGYKYVYGRPTGYTYGLYAYVEDLGSTNGNYVGNNCSGAPCACNSGCNYRVLNP